MSSFYCKECNKLVEASEGCPHWTFINHKIGNKPKRKSFEFEGYEKYTVFRLDHVGEIKEQDGLFHFTADLMISKRYPTKEAAEKARAELIRLNEELL